MGVEVQHHLERITVRTADNAVAVVAYGKDNPLLMQMNKYYGKHDHKEKIHYAQLQLGTFAGFSHIQTLLILLSCWLPKQ